MILFITLRFTRGRGNKSNQTEKHGVFRRNGSIAVDAEHGHLRRRSFFGRARSKSAIAWQADAHGTTLDRETFSKTVQQHKTSMNIKDLCLQQQRRAQLLTQDA
jgi:hypothetical protein